MTLPTSKMDRLRAAARDHFPEAMLELRAKTAEHAPVAREGFRIYNQSDDETVVRVYDEIAWYAVNASDFTAALDDIDTARIRVEVNSPGGDVFDGIAIYQALRNHPAHVTTRVDGIAASIASIIAQAGDTRIVQPASQMMIHNAWGLVVGDSNDHAEMAALLDQQDQVLAGIYATHSGQTADHFRELMNAETWLTAEQIVEHGLADEVVEPPAKNAKDAAPSRPASKLIDEIADAVGAVDAVIDSAARVAALRAEAGKDLSTRVQESLVGLAARCEHVTDVLDPPTQTPSLEAAAVHEWLIRRNEAHARGVL